jgi:hypothetical protein
LNSQRFDTLESVIIELSEYISSERESIKESDNKGEEVEGEVWIICSCVGNTICALDAIDANAGAGVVSENELVDNLQNFNMVLHVLKSSYKYFHIK